MKGLQMMIFVGALGVVFAGAPAFAQNSLEVDAEARGQGSAGTSSGEAQMEAGASADAQAMDGDGDGRDTAATGSTEMDVSVEGGNMQEEQRSHGGVQARAHANLNGLTGVRMQVCSSDGDCDDTDAATAPAQGYARVRVSGAEVRGWSEEQKQEATERARLRANSSADFGMRVAAAAIADESVQEVVSDRNQTEVRYRANLRLFGLLPVGGSATARAYADGNTEVDLPWYAAFSSGGDSEVYTELAADIHADYEAAMGASVQ